jgi:hypothetical protein
MPASQTARPPTSPHANLTAVTRIGTAKWGSAIWTLACTCGTTFDAYATAIKNGKARCATCNPKKSAKDMELILSKLPGTYEQIERRTKLSFGTVRYGLELLRAADRCFIGDYDRANEQGSFRPIFHAGKGDDVPCKLKPIPTAKTKRKYEKRVKAAIAKVENGGPEDGRYIRHISLHLANKTAAEARSKPVTWLSALGV